ncbi:MAG: GNAT family N-acetyltransferase [Frankia sp.]
MRTGTIGFEPLRRPDFLLVGGWLAEPVVTRWWNHDSSAAGVEHDFGPAVDGLDPTEVFLATADGTPFGLIQRYLVSSFVDYLAELNTLYDVPPRALSIDYLIGDPSQRGRGLGSLMIGEFVRASWSAFPGTDAVIVPVCVGNTASWRSLERAGFRRVAEGDLEPDNPIDPPDHYIYRLDLTRPPPPVDPRRSC